jgi:hypothetical protein
MGYGIIHGFLGAFGVGNKTLNFQKSPKSGKYGLKYFSSQFYV